MTIDEWADEELDAMVEDLPLKLPYKTFAAHARSIMSYTTYRVIRTWHILFLKSIDAWMDGHVEI